MEEYRRGEDLPESKLWKETLSFAFQDHPYGVPVVGWPETVRRVTRESLYRFMKKWYRPDNAAFVVAGGTTFEQVFAVAQKYFGSWKAGKRRPRREIFEPSFKWKDPVYVFYKKDLREPRFILVWPGTRLTDVEQAAAADVLAAALGGSGSSRLVKNLRLRKNVLTRISASAWSPRQRGAFFVSGVLRQGEEEIGLREVFAELRMFSRTGPSEEEFENAKESLIKGIISSLENSESVAETFGSYFAEGRDPELFFKYMNALVHTKRERLQELAGEWLKGERAGMVLMLPEGSSVSARDVKRWLREELLEKRGVQRKIKKGSEGVKLYTLKNGLPVLLLERPGTNTIYMTAVFHGGVAAEPPKKQGLGWLTAAAMRRGTRFRSAQEISALEDRYFTLFYAHADAETFGLRAECLKEDFLDAFQVFSEVLLEPSFPVEELEKVKKDQLSLIRKEKENPRSVLMNALARVMYGDHPYGRDVLGTKESVEKLSREDVLKYYHRVVQANNGLLVLVGDFHAEDVLPIVEGYLSNMPAEEESVVVPVVEKRKRVSFEFVPMNTEQAHIVMAFYAPGGKDETRYPMEVVENALAGMSGRLFMDLRDKRALAYSVTAFYRPRAKSGLFIFYMATAPEKVKEAVEGFRQEVDLLLEHSLTGDEIQRAKTFVVGNYKMGFETNSAVGTRLAYTQILTGDYTRVFRFSKRIQNVSTREIRRAILDNLKPTLYTVVIVGPESAKEAVKDLVRWGKNGGTKEKHQQE